jgi:hypothetical protein
MMYEFEKPFVVDSSQFTRTFGMEATPLRDAVRATVGWYQEYATDTALPQAAADVRST